MKRKIIIITCIALIAGFTGCDIPQSDVPEALEELTIADIHKAYEEGKYNSRQLVEAYISRIELLNNEINALTIINPDALHEADEARQGIQGNSCAASPPWHTADCKG
ncbi:MAG: hypothetical protein U5K32_07675 [Bacteroidales bacterium]|nr:hypothetical protein [Bacteroidales bacterium]